MNNTVSALNKEDADMTKISVAELQVILPVSNHTIRRFSREDSKFPAPVIIGRANYFDRAMIYKWLSSRASAANTIQDSDVILTTDQAGILLGRSRAWVWKNITTNNQFTLVDLSPGAKSGKPKPYFIKREVLEAFPDLAAIAAQKAA
ncbi:MAG: hypothetical protein KDI44_19170 [Thiothrix sp.]|nr:hypothetical protein [Thiothrix sp.]